MMAKMLKTAAKAKRSGGKGKPLPPMPKGGRGSIILESKSGRYIIASPVKSANTVDSWSNAFKVN
jgi:hypothetical protein